jgi:hypothetical protein
MLDIPLDEALDTHTLTKAAVTNIAKEFDNDKLGKGPKMADVEAQDIYGLSDITDEQSR